MKSLNSKQWYSKLKRISSYNSHLLEPTQVSDISEHSDKDQAELIANKFSQISQEYDALNTCDIKVPPFTKESIPHISQVKVKHTLKHMKTKISTIPGDIPATNIHYKFMHRKRSMARPMESRGCHSNSQSTPNCLNR